MSGRVTRPPAPSEIPTLRDRNPRVWWVAVVTVAALVLSALAGVLAAVLS